MTVGVQLTPRGGGLGSAPGLPGGFGAVDGITSGQVAEQRKDLGRQLAGWRAAVGMTQAQLAKQICYSRSTLANAETGRDMSVRGFWCDADDVVGANGALLAAFDQVAALVRDFHEQQASVRDRERRQRAGRLVAAAVPAGSRVPVEPGRCQCETVVVGRWTGREVRALREALRMTVHDFAQRLGASGATVSGWEHRRTPTPPKMAAQAALDQTLALADTDTKARFLLILNNS
ncbi:helix-turn-helix domain-containing protein [Micromonospora sp. Rc5]|uniref:helix-turn-helix domain-containing protein n=1 Tax=Micromonospora sp. Rc5 TaxID=1920666 RepID=UPI001E2E1AB1|nr:helix-turn-helix domain-containing protein [Micromonospora sp. Rc5]